MSDTRPLGVFDSGLGGLSVVKEIRRRLPHEGIVYIADSAYVPYGGRPLEEIRDRATSVVQALVDRGAKVIVVACNTASAAAIDDLRVKFSLPIVGLEPAVKPAAASTEVGRIAVLATPATLRTERFHRLVDRHAAGVHLLKVPCPGFVELVESGEVEGENAQCVVSEALAPVVAARADRVVLGCTHYPFLAPLIATELGDGVQILASGEAVARQVERVLAQNDLLATGGEAGITLLTTGDPAAVQPVAARLWSPDIRVGPVD